jgi:hypothetical protein
MKNIAPFLIAVLLASSAIAQNENENENEYEQRVYVVRAIAIEPQEDRKVLVAECEAAIAAAGITGIDMQGPNARVGRGSLHRLLNQDKYGRVREEKSQEKQRGEVLICQYFDSFFIDQGRNFIPSFYVVSIDGLTFVAEGGGIADAFGQLPGGAQVMAPTGQNEVFYPAQGVVLLSSSATILPSLPYDLAISLGIPESQAAFGGTMSLNGIGDNADPNGEDDQFETEGYYVIRLLISIQN